MFTLLHQQLLLNILFVISPLFLYQFFFLERNKDIYSKSHEIFFTILCAASILLCMSVPITLSPGFIFDLRLIPLALGILYVGRWYSLSLVALLLSYRFMLGGEGFYIALMIVPLMWLIGFELKKAFTKASFRNKFWIVIILVGIPASLTFILYPIFAHLENYLILTLGSLALEFLGAAFSIYILETMLANHRMKSELNQAEKLNVLSQLAASISHEVRNPLTVIKGFLQLLKQDDVTRDHRINYMNLALRELEQAESIITEYLTFAKPTYERKDENLNLADEITQVVHILTPYAKMESVEFYYQLDSDCMIKAEKQKLRQVFVNLIKNSIEAIEDGGSIHIYLERKEDDYTIDLIDTGMGMSSSTIAKLGSPFYTTKEKGTGLGMLVVYSIIEALHGSIQVKSEKGKGTHFSIRLPINLP